MIITDNRTPLPLSDIAHSRHFRGSQQIFCKTFSPSDYRKNSEFVYKTVPLGLGSRAGACVASTHLAPSPLRLIVARSTIEVPICEGYELFYWLDTLSCGHQLEVFPQNPESGKHRHRCIECREAAEAAAAPKFPPQSIPFPGKKKTA